MNAGVAARAQALALARAHFDGGDFARDLARRVAIRTESQDPASGPALRAYLDTEMRQTLEPLGFACEVFDNPVPAYGPLLIARRHESGTAPPVVMYGHGDPSLDAHAVRTRLRPPPRGNQGPQPDCRPRDRRAAPTARWD